MAEYLKDPALELRYQELFKTTASPGWEHLVEEMKELVEPLRDMRTVRDLDDLRYRQGMINILDRLITYREVVREDYDTLLADEARGDPDESF